MTVGLTPRESQCLDAIRRLTKNGVPPSYSELAEEIGVASKSNVVRYVRGLEKRGALRLTPGAPRSLHVVERRPPTAAELHRFETAELLTLLAHVCSVLGHRLGTGKLRETLDRIGNRLAGRRAA